MLNIGFYDFLNNVCQSLSENEDILNFQKRISITMDKINVMDKKTLHGTVISSGVIDIKDDLELFKMNKYNFIHILDQIHGGLLIIEITHNPSYFLEEINHYLYEEGDYICDNRGVFINKKSNALVYLTEFEDMNKYFVFISNNYDLFFHDYYTGDLLSEHFC